MNYLHISQNIDMLKNKLSNMEILYNYLDGNIVTVEFPWWKY